MRRFSQQSTVQSKFSELFAGKSMALDELEIRLQAFFRKYGLTDLQAQTNALLQKTLQSYDNELRQSGTPNLSGFSDPEIEVTVNTGDMVTEVVKNVVVSMNISGETFTWMLPGSVFTGQTRTGTVNAKFLRVSQSKFRFLIKLGEEFFQTMAVAAHSAGKDLQVLKQDEAPIKAFIETLAANVLKRTGHPEYNIDPAEFGKYFDFSDVEKLLQQYGLHSAADLQKYPKIQSIIQKSIESKLNVLRWERVDQVVQAIPASQKPIVREFLLSPKNPVANKILEDPSALEAQQLMHAVERYLVENPKATKIDMNKVVSMFKQTNGAAQFSVPKVRVNLQGAKDFLKSHIMWFIFPAAKAKRTFARVLTYTATLITLAPFIERTNPTDPVLKNLATALSTAQQSAVGPWAFLLTSPVAYLTRIMFGPLFPSSAPAKVQKIAEEQKSKLPPAQQALNDVKSQAPVAKPQFHRPLPGEVPRPSDGTFVPTVGGTQGKKYDNSLENQAKEKTKSLFDR